MGSEEMRKVEYTILFLGCLVTFIGCQQFPEKFVEQKKNVRIWKVQQKERPDYFQYLDDKGKIYALGFDENNDGKVDLRVNFLSVVNAKDCPHYVILLDGIPYILIKQMYDEGYFRLFYPPQKLISEFPPMTDLAYSQIFHTTPLLGFECLYYDRSKNRLSNADMVYLSQKNAPWQKYLDYRAPMIFDPLGYINPDFLFNHELRSIESTINRKRKGTVIVYSVGTATIGTRKGKEGFIDCLKRINYLCEKLVYERRGKVAITMLADHGHNLVPAKYFNLRKALKKWGFHPTNRLKKPEDIICIEYGLITATFLYTNQPEKVAACMAKEQAVDLAVYFDKLRDKVVVVGEKGIAYVSKTDKGYKYEAVKGDPLKLKSIIQKLKSEGKVDSSGIIDDRALFLATVDHIYPDPLYRLWKCFHGQALFPPDVVLSIKDGWCCGKESFAKTINVASTHGSLNWINSVTFIMSTIKPIDTPMRLTDVKSIINFKNKVIP